MTRNGGWDVAGARLIYKPAGVVEYIREDGWAVRIQMGFDEVRSAEILDLRAVREWFPGNDPLGLSHDPSERREVSDVDTMEIADAFGRNYASRRRPLLIIRRDGGEELQEPPPEPQLNIRTAEPSIGPRVRGRKPKRGRLSEKMSGKGAVLAMATATVAPALVFAGLVLLRMGPVWGIVGMVTIGLALAVMIGIGVLVVQETWRFRGRIRANQCVECGYSRANLVPGTPCPECGAGDWFDHR
jgi:hypothetical protein